MREWLVPVIISHWAWALAGMKDIIFVGHARLQVHQRGRIINEACKAILQQTRL
jgi:hypothetical protein